MPRKKSGGPRSEPHESFVFEIERWEPSYTFSVNHDRGRPGEYVEYAELHFETVCALPKELVGRAVHFILSGRRNCFDPPPKDADKEETANSAGWLDIGKHGGSYYGGVPHDTIPYFMVGLMAGGFRYFMLSGPPLKRGRSSVRHLHLMRDAELETEATG